MEPWVTCEGLVWGLGAESLKDSQITLFDLKIFPKLQWQVKAAITQTMEMDMTNVTKHKITIQVMVKVEVNSKIRNPWTEQWSKVGLERNNTDEQKLKSTGIILQSSAKIDDPTQWLD